jgi:outer membrane protein assembly factor BamB
MRESIPMKKITLICFIVVGFHFCMEAQNPTIKWWYDVLDSSFGQSAAGDIDKDGKLEIVFGCYRNDSCIYALNAENGTLQWKFNAKTNLAEGCNDVAVLIADTDQDDTLDVVVPSSCNPKTYCFRGKDGSIKWQTNTAGSDSPPSMADVDQDGKPEILHGGFDGKVMCLNAENGSVAWTLPVFNNAWVQTAPTLVDLNNNGVLDIVVSTWAFSPDTSRIYAYNGSTQALLWSKPVSDYVYHGTAVGDIDQDGKPELIFGDYNGKIYALNGEDGSTLWTYQAQVYVGAPATIADINQDGYCDVVYCDGYGVGALDRYGNSMWYYSIPNYGQSFRGVAVADVTGDYNLDIVFGTQTGKVYALNGSNGILHWDIDLKAHIGKKFDINHAPLISDFDDDGKMDVFVVGGSTEYPNFSANYGRAYLISTGPGHGPDWMMFQQDIKRQSNICNFPVGIPETDIAPSMTIYPNPAHHKIRLEGIGPGRVSIYNTVGERINTYKTDAHNIEIQVADLSPGIYLIEFVGKHYTRKQAVTIH